MRAPFLLTLSFVAGFGAGYALFLRPAVSAKAGAGLAWAEGEPAGVAAPRDAMSTEEKARHLVEAALRKTSALDRDSELYLAIQAFGPDDFRKFMHDAAALKAFVEKLKGVDDEHLLSGLIARWVAVDREGIVAWAPRVFELFPKKENARRVVLDALAARLPGEMLGLVASLKDPEERESIISRALRVLAAKDAAKAQAWLKGCSDPKDRLAAEKAIRLGTVEADPMRAVELAGSVERGEAREIMEAATNQARKMGAGVLRQLAATPMKSWMLGSVISEFAEREPEFAVDLVLRALSESSSDAQIFPLQSAFTALARKDHVAAISKLDEIKGAQERAAAISVIGVEWAASDPAAALAWLSGKSVSERTNVHESSYDSNDSLLMAFGKWAETARSDAQAWADALPAGELHDQLTIHLARILAARGDAAEATQILFGIGGSGQASALATVARSWAREDPQAAADWAISQPAGPLQSRTLAAVVGSWGNTNPDGVQDWLAQFPPGETRDRSISAFLNRPGVWAGDAQQQIAEFDAWFDVIEDPWLRARAATINFWARRRSDPAAARAWLSGLQNVDPTVIRLALSRDEN